MRFLDWGRLWRGGAAPIDEVLGLHRQSMEEAVVFETSEVERSQLIAIQKTAVLAKLRRHHAHIYRLRSFVATVS